MRYVIIHLVTFIVCFFGLTGCLVGSGKQVRFACDDSMLPGNFEKQITTIAQSHQFFSAPPEKEGLRFYSKLKSSPSLYAMITRSRTPEIILGISILRAPGTGDKLPPEVLDVFDAVVLEVSEQFAKSCRVKSE